MSIVAMKRLRLIALRQDREEILKALQRLGCVEVDERQAEADDPVWEGLTRPSDEGVHQLRERREQAIQALTLLEQNGGDKPGLLSPRPTVAGKDFFDPRSDRAGETARAVCEAKRELEALANEAAKLRSQRAALGPWLTLNVPLETSSTDATTALFGALPVPCGLEKLEEELAEAGEFCAVTPGGTDTNFQYLFFLCHNSVSEQAREVLRRLGFSQSSFRGMTGTAAENDRRLERLLAENEAKAAQIQASIETYAEKTGELRLYLDRSGQELSREEAKTRVVDTDAAFCLSGWFPAEEEERLKGVLDRFLCAWETAEPTEEEYPQVPVKLKNGFLTRCMNTITEMYSLPAYDGIDPNPLMFPFFVVFFGMMMADMAYGIIMVAGTAFVLLKARPKESMRNFMELFFWCGISTFIWGALTGGFLGDFIPQLLKLIDPASTFTMPALFTPLNDTIAILIGSLILGLIQVVTGMAISVVRKVQAGDLVDALFNEITWWIILAGVALAVLGIGNVGGMPVVLIVGALMLALGGTRNAKGFGKLTSLIGLVYNGISGFFSDILSYLRLMALMLAGSVISQVFNTLGSVFGNVVGFVIISLIGNALNLALNLLGCYVHDLRLQCLEYFGRFYKEGGRAFSPLKVETQYVDIIKEEN